MRDLNKGLDDGNLRNTSHDAWQHTDTVYGGTHKSMTAWRWCRRLSNQGSAQALYICQAIAEICALVFNN